MYCVRRSLYFMYYLLTITIGCLKWVFIFNYVCNFYRAYLQNCNFKVFLYICVKFAKHNGELYNLCSSPNNF
jgi:hypothetical protein